MPLQVTAPAYGPSNANQSAGLQQDIGSKEVFLQLLVAQMEHQDPLNPSDPTEMSAQLARFNMVEQQINTNKLLEQLVGGGGLNGGDISGSSASYLGRNVTVTQNSIYHASGTESVTLNMGANSNQTYVVVLDETGTPVRTLNLGAVAAGNNSITWDGLSDTGQVAPAGNYTFEVLAADANGMSIPAVIQRSGMVDAVRMTPYGVELMVGGMPASVSDVTEIRL